MALTDRQTNTHRKLENMCKLFFKLNFVTKKTFFVLFKIISKRKKFTKISNHCLVTKKIVKRNWTNNFGNKNLQYILLGNLVTTKLRQTLFYCHVLTFCEKLCCDTKIKSNKLNWEFLYVKKNLIRKNTYNTIWFCHQNFLSFFF